MRFFVAASMLFIGCGPPNEARVTVQIHWRFADARRCAEAGAQQVQITADDTATLACQPATCVLPCAEGETVAGASLSIGAVGARLHFAAVSAPGDSLYRGTLDLAAPVPADASALLYFTAGR